MASENAILGPMTNIPLPPKSLLPEDGRFGAGPSLIRPEQVQALAQATELGTSHRKPPVRNRVASIQSGLRDLLGVPEDFEIVLGQGGATAFWAVATSSLIEKKARLAVFGEFGGKFAADVERTPWLQAEVVEAIPGALATVQQDSATADVYAYPQNETSTGVVSPLYRGAPNALTLVDATSIAGAGPVDWAATDVYYFSPQKCFGAEGGLWVAILSPAAVARAEKLAADPERYMPAFLNLEDAIKQSRLHQTVNTPAVSTLILFDEQIKWMLEQGGLAVTAAMAAEGAGLIQKWAESRDYASLFVEAPPWRSPVVTTVDLAAELPANDIAAALREVGILDIDGYRKLGRNQLRIASFPSISHANIEALLNTLDWVADNVGQPFSSKRS